MSETVVTRTRRIDGGDPLLLWDPPGQDEDLVGCSITTAVCDNPECPCTTMWLSIRRIERADSGKIENHGPALSAEVSAENVELKLDDESSDAFPSEVTEWLRMQLDVHEQRAWLRERWRRARGQIGDPAYPSGVPPKDADGLVSFYEVFPYDFDLTVVYQRQLYLAEDQYCLRPACSCKDVAVRFIDLSQGSKSLGITRASVRRLKAIKINGPPLLRRLHDRLIEQHGDKTLRERFKRMRELARAQESPAALRQTKVGRNAPCPCGSGKKYKRCCGR